MSENMIKQVRLRLKELEQGAKKNLEIYLECPDNNRDAKNVYNGIILEWTKLDSYFSVIEKNRNIKQVF